MRKDAWSQDRDPTPSGRGRRGSELFTLRLWTEETGRGGRVHRGRVQHVVSGEAIHFRDWPSFLDFVLEKLDASGPAARTHSTEGGRDE